MNVPGALLSPELLQGVAASWRKSARVFQTAFGGHSMMPAIAPGQTVTVDCSADPGVGDVAVFRFDGRVGVHRVVRREADWFLTWGDANPLPDPPLRHDALIGALRDVAPRRTPFGRRLLLALLAPRGAAFERANRRIARAQALYRARREGHLFATCLEKLTRRPA